MGWQRLVGMSLVGVGVVVDVDVGGVGGDAVFSELVGELVGGEVGPDEDG
jgi:hypothetical protein